MREILVTRPIINGAEQEFRLSILVPGTGNGGVIPLRWQYPTNEITTNNENLKAALQSQYGGSDDINAKMWLIK